MQTADWISLSAAAIALFSIALHLVLRELDRREARHQGVIAALQGEKEAVGYEAYRLVVSGWPEDPAERRQVCDALCLAFVFERSDRSRALIAGAVDKAAQDERSTVSQSLTQISHLFENVEAHNTESSRGEWDLHRAWPKIAILGRMLRADEVVTAAEKRLPSA